MNDLLQLLYVDGNILETVCRIFVLFIALDSFLSICSIIGDAKRSVM